MRLHTEPFDEQKHYKTICEWWKWWKWPELPLESLPKTGLVACVDESPVCAGWVYRTDSNICWMEWIISNPQAGKAERHAAIELLLDALTESAELMGYKVIFTSARNQHLIRRLNGRGFAVTDREMTNLTKVI